MTFPVESTASVAIFRARASVRIQYAPARLEVHTRLRILVPASLHASDAAEQLERVLRESDSTPELVKLLRARQMCLRKLFLTHLQVPSRMWPAPASGSTRMWPRRRTIVKLGRGSPLVVQGPVLRKVRELMLRDCPCAGASSLSNNRQAKSRRIPTFPNMLLLHQPSRACPLHSPEERSASS